MTETGRRVVIRISKAVVFVILALALVGAAGNVVKPARKANKLGGAWHSYKSLPKNSIDVLMLGTSHTFTSMDPNVIWETAGVPSFTLAGPTQRLGVTRYYLEEALRTQKPKVVALEMVGSAYDPTHSNPKFLLINAGYMPMGVNRLKVAAFETQWGYKGGVIFDLWQYHSRWTEITKDDVDLRDKAAGYEYLKGYIPMVGARKPVNKVPVELPAEEDLDQLSDRVAANYADLRRIAAICEKHDAQLLLWLAPTGPPQLYSKHLIPAYSRLSGEYPNVKMLDLSALGRVPDLDYEKDFFDGGHLNTRGAVKASREFAEFVTETYQLEDKRRQAAYSGWDEDLAEHDEYLASLERWRQRKRIK